MSSYSNFPLEWISIKNICRELLTASISILKYYPLVPAAQPLFAPCVSIPDAANFNLWCATSGVFPENKSPVPNAHRDIIVCRAAIPDQKKK